MLEKQWKITSRRKYDNSTTKKKKKQIQPMTEKKNY